MIALMLLFLLIIWPFVKAPITVECTRVATQDNCIVRSKDNQIHRVSFHGVTLIPRSGDHPFSTTWVLETVDVDGKPVKVKRINGR